MLKKNYDNASSQNEYISQRISARSVNLAENFLIKDGRCPPQFMVDAYHFHIETTFDTTDSVKLSKHSSSFLQRRIYTVQS